MCFLIIKKILIMKILIPLIISILCFTQMSAQDYYYYYKGEKIYLELNPDYIFISSTNESDVQNARINVPIDNNNSNEITEEKVRQTLAKPTGFIEQYPVRHWREVNLTGNLSQARYLTEIQQLRVDNSNLIVAPYFQNESDDKIGLSNYFYVKLKHQDDFNALLDQIEKHQVELVGYNKFMPLWFTLSVTPSTSNAMQMANLFYEIGLFEYAEPDLMVDRMLNSTQSPSNMAFVPNDPLYPDQWHLNNTGQNGGVAGIDINTEDAWDITLGSSNINVAIVDQGFEMDHPDLVNNTVGTGYDTETGTIPSVVWGNHGTPCAGLIGAESNNNEGVSGVAPNTGLISVSQSFGFVNTTQELADGINWAWQNGADVISNSWGGGSPNALIDDAITNALTNGRGGLGAIVVFSSGNDNLNGAQYPSNSNPDILCVGAIDRCGIRSGRIDIIPESCAPWCSGCRPGSSFGTPLDVVAGGTSITATDRQDSNGYNGYPTDLDYTNDFGGTSSACPIVAGVAALVLSVNPNLTVQEVGDIIEQSAQKIRTDNYTYQITANRPNGTWNNELGYGLVDAYQAVLLAQDCATNLILNVTINSGTYEASNSITSRGIIGANQNVTYDAGSFISLNPNFEADASNGSEFLAHIDGCGNMNRIAQENGITQNEPVNYSMERLAVNTIIEQVSIKNYPNPFTGQTTIEFALEKDVPVSLFVSDLTGRQIAVLLNDEQRTKGIHQVIFDGNKHPAGMYYYTIQAGDYVATQKMTLVK